MEDAPAPLGRLTRVSHRMLTYQGWLSLIISLSDLAAMGAEPLGVLISCEMPNSMLVRDFLSFLEGAKMASGRYNCAILGGNVKDFDKFNVVTSIAGTTRDRKPLRRFGCRSGDSVFVLGNMGYLHSAVLYRKHGLLLSSSDAAKLENALRYPEANLWAGVELAKTGEITSCMDASDGPTGCLHALAELNSVDIIVSRSALRPQGVVGEVARQLGIDAKALMLSWGNWELVFTANYERLRKRLGSHPIMDEMIKVGSVVRGNGHAVFDDGTALPDLSSKRFHQYSSFTQGIDGYLKLLCATRV